MTNFLANKGSQIGNSNVWFVIKEYWAPRNLWKKLNNVENVDNLKSVCKIFWPFDWSYISRTWHRRHPTSLILLFLICKTEIPLKYTSKLLGKNQAFALAVTLTLFGAIPISNQFTFGYNDNTSFLRYHWWWMQRQSHTNQFLIL